MTFTLSCIQKLLGCVLQTKHELRAPLRPVRGGQISSELARDTDRNHQTEAETSAGLFGRKERLE
jgi:hypothetical protein